ncbi:hypothetical protein PQ465_13605 [Sphingobacterium oryzagri]|uniref:Uncharacterized protein n=1 Tax=Sphingobacterium oryzagri TaxID=3025669 RepID=A0ABY7WCF1_9SPHI|nr:hypothetical protein [Sphingobacterium sp. KACC 22765]WDF67341.1 hypothetical protein PQ465_13605 [Sphingobacterium sp. KACC 22765]
MAVSAIVSLKKIKLPIKPTLPVYSIHVIRVIVEIILLALYKQEKIPRLMTLEGWNIDILFGISALVIWYGVAVKRFEFSKKVILLWNLLGILSLFWVLMIGILSSPLPLQQLAFDMPNTAVLIFPYSLLPAVVVPLIILVHLIEIKRLTLLDNTITIK